MYVLFCKQIYYYKKNYIKSTIVSETYLFTLKIPLSKFIYVFLQQIFFYEEIRNQPRFCPLLLSFISVTFDLSISSIWR